MTKQVTKSAPAKTTATKTTAAKPVVKSKTPMREVVKNLHIITDIARPQSGPRLFAHTIAAMHVLGMFDKDRPAVLRSALQSMIGSTAIRYHAKTKGNLLEQGDRVRLSEPGLSFFRNRRVDADEARGFETLFKTGNGEAAKIRAQHIVPVSIAV